MKKKRFFSPLLVLIIVAIVAVVVIKSGISLNPAKNNGEHNGTDVVIGTATDRDLEPSTEPPNDQYLPATAKDLYTNNNSEK